MQNIFGQKVRALRELQGLSQADVSRKLGYSGGGYIHDVERGAFIPPEAKRKQFAKALGVTPELMEDIALEAKLIDLGIREPGFVSMFKDYRKLSRADRQSIIRTYQEIKKRKNGPDRP